MTHDSVPAPPIEEGSRFHDFSPTKPGCRPGPSRGNASSLPVAPELQADAQDSPWLDTAWLQQPARSRLILTRRLSGETLDAVAQDLGLVRERVRQVQKKSTDQLVAAQQAHDPGLLATLESAFGALSALSEEEVAKPRSTDRLDG